MFPRGPLREEQIGNVDAREQQHDSNHDDQHIEWAPIELAHAQKAVCAEMSRIGSRNSVSRSCGNATEIAASRNCGWSPRKMALPISSD